MSSNYDIINAGPLFLGTSVYNTFNSCIFAGNYTSENITDMIENTAGSHISTKKCVTGHSSNICKIKLGDNTTGAEIDPFSNNANNRLDINTCKINETDKWKFTVMAGQAPIDHDCFKYVSPVTRTSANDKNELKYLYKASMTDIKNKSEITSNSNKFKSLVIIIDPGFATDSLDSNIREASATIFSFAIKILIKDTNDNEVPLTEFNIYEIVANNIMKKDVFYNNYLKYVNTGGIPKVICDYDATYRGEKPFIKLVFGNDVLHTILIRPEFDKDSNDLYMNIRTIKSSNYNDSNSKTESRTWIYNIKTRKINTDVSRYKNKRSLIFNINNIENTKSSLSTREKTIIEYTRRLFYFTSNLSSGSSIDSNKDLFLFNMFNIMNDKDYNGSVSCGYIQQVIMAPENMKEQVFGEKAQNVLHGVYDDEARYYPLNLKSF